jgi:hypothetical protein
MGRPGAGRQGQGEAWCRPPGPGGGLVEAARGRWRQECQF